MSTDLPTGFILVDKPATWTSHGVVAYLRRVTKVKKIGHAGTLDPFATGLLIVGIGRAATRRLDEFKGLPKEYVATIRLGYTSDTLDSDGVITAAATPPDATAADIEAVLTHFIGEQEQVPPMYSAKKVAGKKLYELARAGQTIERAPSTITIYDIELLSSEADTIEIRCVVSAGTYIRVLAADIGQVLDTGAYCHTLRRTAIGPYRVDQVRGPKEINSDDWQTHLATLDEHTPVT